MSDAYGEWPSPVSPATLAESGVGFGHLALDDGTTYWLETRPDEEGRGVIARETSEGFEELTPGDVDVRSLVHEYGGGDFAVDEGVVWYADYDDQRLYRLEAGDPELITPDPAIDRGDRYADLEVAGDHIYCVRERHHPEGEPDNEIVVVPTDGSEAPRVVATGHDFYAAPRVDPAGERVAYLAWDHPRMPWDGTLLRVADVGADGSLKDERTVLGGPEESVFQPEWGPEGDLYAVSDRTGWWNLYRVRPDEAESGPVNLHPREAEFGVPQWAFGLSTYDFLADGSIAVVVTEAGRRRPGVLEPGTGDPPYALRFPDPGWSVHKHGRVRADGQSVVHVATSPDAPERLVRWDPPGADPDVLRVGAETDLDPSYVSEPEHLTFPTGDGEEAHGFYYPPHNPDATPPADELPPAVVTVHGGPTSQTVPAFDLDVQLFTTRGIGVFDLNYRGSTGYGRTYRERLTGEWGVVDAEDCANAARHLAESGRADPERIAVRGGSAGGYAALCSLAFHDEFDAGVSYYGVADLAALAEMTHKFESRYLDSLVGPYPEREDRYRERSPVYHADSIRAPVLLLQGSEDPVVPPEQSETMLDALAENGVAHAYVEFEGEQHGFREAESIRRSAEAELAFLGAVFGFEAEGAGEIDLRTG